MKTAQLCVKAALSRKAANIVLLDVKGKTDFCDYKVICSGDSDRQTRAIADAVEEHVFTNLGIKPAAVEGKGSGYWILIDFGGTVVHVFSKEYREYYAIEQLWPNCRIDLPSAV